MHTCKIKTTNCSMFFLIRCDPIGKKKFNSILILWFFTASSHHRIIFHYFIQTILFPSALSLAHLITQQALFCLNLNCASFVSRDCHRLIGLVCVGKKMHSQMNFTVLSNLSQPFQVFSRFGVGFVCRFIIYFSN